MQSEHLMIQVIGVLNWAVLADRLLTLHGCFFLLSAVPSLGDKPGANCFNELAMSNLSCSWPQRSMASDLESFRERTTKYTPAQILFVTKPMEFISMSRNRTCAEFCNM